MKRSIVPTGLSAGTSGFVSLVVALMVPVVGTVLSVVVINRCLSADDIAGLMHGNIGLGHFLGQRDSAKVELHFACVPSETDEQSA